MLVWLPFEDLQQNWVLLFSIAIAGLTSAYFLARTTEKLKHSWWLYLLTGLLAGLAVTPLAIFLMALKGGIHSHPSADFTAQQVLQVIYTTPVWILAGSLIGLGIASGAAASKRG
jgi:ethanolamine transporter EutH